MRSQAKQAACWRDTKGYTCDPFKICCHISYENVHNIEFYMYGI